MEIKIRNLDSATVKRIDEEAEHHHVSREEYLRRLIERDRMTSSEFITRDNEMIIFNAMVQLVKRNNELLEIIEEFYHDK